MIKYFRKVKNLKQTVGTNNFTSGLDKKLKYLTSDSQGQ